METIKRLFSIDEKSNTIIQYVSRKSFVFSGDKTLQHETNLDSVSLTMRLKELANKKLVTSEIVNQKKAYWLSYIHDESVLDGGEK